MTGDVVTRDVRTGTRVPGMVAPGSLEPRAVVNGGSIRSGRGRP
jgi:hypothetical protein